MMAQPSEQQLSTLLAGVGIVRPEQDVPVLGVETDSRRMRAGAAFLACASHDGQRHGLDHLPEVLNKNPAAIVWEPAAARSLPRTGVPQVSVPDLSRHVSLLAARSFEHPGESLQVVGVTGTDGKTSVAHLLAQALTRLGRRCGYLGTLGCGELDALQPGTHTTPDAVALQQWLATMRDEGMDSIAMEVSSHALDQHRVDAAAFDVALLTNLGRDHLDYHGEVAAYHAAKRRLFGFRSLSAMILNQDDPGGAAWLTEFAARRGDAQLISYGMAEDAHSAAEAHVLAAVETHATGLTLQLTGSWGDATVESRLLGRFNASNLLAVAAVLLQRGFEIHDTAAVLSQLQPVPGRMQLIDPDPALPTVVVDYAHTPQALEQALASLRAHTAGKLWCVFGCGGDRDRGKRPLMAAAAERLADHVIVTDDNPRTESPQQIVAGIAEGFSDPGSIRIEHDRRAAIGTAIGEALPGDVVLIAGKGHEDYQLVGNQQLDFDDRVVAAEALHAREAGSC